MSRSDYHARLAKKYATRVISVSYGRAKYFSVKGTLFSFRVTPCPTTGKPILNSSIVYPDGTTLGADRLVLLIKGLRPCKDVPYGGNGRLSIPVSGFRLTTRIAIRDFSKPRRRRKYFQEIRRAAEAAETDE